MGCRKKVISDVSDITTVGRIFFILLFIHLKPIFVRSQCQQNYNWTTWTSFTPNSATGNILYNGQPINVTMTANYNFGSTPNIYNYDAFKNFYAPPSNSIVPQTTWAIGQGGETKMCFSSQVENPVLLIASQGSAWIEVSLKFSRPYILVYDGGGNRFPNDSTIIAREGYAIIKFPGKFDCVTIYSTDYEYYTNITWGLNPPLFPITVVKNGSSCKEVSYTASGGKKYSWSGGLYPDSSTNVFNSTGTYFLTVTDDRGCSVNTSVNVQTDGTSELTLLNGQTDQSVCVNSEIIPIEYLYGTVSSGISVSGLPPGVNYTYANGLLRISGKPTAASLTPFKFIVSNVTNCGSIKDSGTIKVNPIPLVNAGVDKKVQSGTTVQLQGKTSGILKSLLWTPSQGLSDPASLNPSIKIIQTTEFTITATSVDNCTASDNVLIQVLEEIIPPNIFSPNGDGINDKWYIKNIDSYDNIEVKIFNRYGVLLLDKKGYNSSTAWDGTHNGKNLPVGTYFYVIKMTENKLINGAVSIIR